VSLLIPSATRESWTSVISGSIADGVSLVAQLAANNRSAVIIKRFRTMVSKKIRGAFPPPVII
jgi:hypothetical protein